MPANTIEMTIQDESLKLDDLPPEILTAIFKFLDRSSLLNVRATSKKWMQIASQESAWSRDSLRSSNYISELITASALGVFSVDPVTRESYETQVKKINFIIRKSHLERAQINQLINKANEVHDQLVRQHDVPISEHDVNKRLGVSVFCFIAALVTDGFIFAVKDRIISTDSWKTNLARNDFGLSIYDRITNKSACYRPYFNSHYDPSHIDFNDCRLSIQSQIESAIKAWFIFGVILAYMLDAVESMLLNKIHKFHSIHSLPRMQDGTFYSQLKSSAKQATSSLFAHRDFFYLGVGLLLSLIFYLLKPMEYDPRECLVSTSSNGQDYRVDQGCLADNLNDLEHNLIGFSIAIGLLLAKAFNPLAAKAMHGAVRLGIKAKEAYQRYHLFRQANNSGRNDVEEALELLVAHGLNNA